MRAGVSAGEAGERGQEVTKKQASVARKLAATNAENVPVAVCSARLPRADRADGRSSVCGDAAWKPDAHAAHYKPNL